MNTASRNPIRSLQRRANLEELKKLGVELYPHRFERRQTIDAIVAAHGARTQRRARGRRRFDDA